MNSYLYIYSYIYITSGSRCGDSGYAAVHLIDRVDFGKVSTIKAVVNDRQFYNKFKYRVYIIYQLVIYVHVQVSLKVAFNFI